jgi:hypothetical protein
MPIALLPSPESPKTRCNC